MVKMSIHTVVKNSLDVEWTKIPQRKYICLQFESSEYLLNILYLKFSSLLLISSNFVD